MKMVSTQDLMPYLQNVATLKNILQSFIKTSRSKCKDVKQVNNLAATNLKFQRVKLSF